MTEAEYLAGADPDAMLALLSERLSPRQWHLLACAAVRRLQALLPPESLAVLEWCEANAGAAHELSDEADRRMQAAHDAVEAARPFGEATQAEAVRAAEPDADPESFLHTVAGRPVPAAPLFQAACRYARTSIERAGEASAQAALAVPLLIDAPGRDQLEMVREQVLRAGQMQGSASLAAATALKFHALADADSDVDPRKKADLRYAAATQTVTTEDEGEKTRAGDMEVAKERAERKTVGKLIQDIAGNPFRPLRLDAAWRTPEVTALARAIFEARAFERMPALASELLAADCDEEAVLRHCRGTEPHAPEGPLHSRGCWVLDLVLDREPAYAAAPVLEPPPPPKPALPRPKPGGALGGAGLDKLLKALKNPKGED